MGRSGGGNGGGGHASGGFSGGGRASGGFSGGGGGRTGGSAGGFGGGPAGSPRGGWSGPGHPEPHHHHHRGGFGWGSPMWGGFGWGPVINVGGPRPPRRDGRGGCGCLGTLVGLVLALMLVSLLYGAVGSCSYLGSSGYGSGYSYSQGSASSSSTVRTKLEGAVTKTGWYTDEDGDWIHSASRLEAGLAHFYDKTGVQPYVYILENGSVTSTDELNQKSQELYDELFSDEGHFLLVFCDDGEGGFNCGYTIGTQARTVMDDEAVGILQEALSNAYNNADTDEEVFSDAFAETADAIMGAAETQEKSETAERVGLAVVGVLVVGGIAYAIVRKRKKDEAERRARVDEVLNTPLEQFGGDDVEDLASKYEKK